MGIGTPWPGSEFRHKERNEARTLVEIQAECAGLGFMVVSKDGLHVRENGVQITSHQVSVVAYRLAELQDNLLQRQKDAFLFVAAALRSRRNFSCVSPLPPAERSECCRKG
jgi:hypothetical protein